MVDILDKHFPKGKCKERGEAMVMLGFIEMMLNGMIFVNGEPKMMVDGVHWCPTCDKPLEEIVDNIAGKKTGHLFRCNTCAPHLNISIG